MKYLFDTDLISTLMIGRASARLLARLAAVGADNQAISSITALEIFYGAYKTADPQRFLSLFEEKVLSNVVVLPFDDTAARLAGCAELTVSAAISRIASNSHLPTDRFLIFSTDAMTTPFKTSISISLNFLI